MDPRSAKAYQPVSDWVQLLPGDDVEKEEVENWASKNSEEGFQVKMEALLE